MSYAAGRRSRDRPGTDGAPRGDGLDVRWGSAYAELTTSAPQTKPLVWELLRDVWDQGHRAPRAAANPFMLRDPL